MDIYLRNDKEKQTFHFPVNPIGDITVNRSKKYNTVDIIDYGEVDLSDKGKKIKELSFNTLLPKEYDTYCRYRNIPKPTEAIAKLEKWMEQQEPLRLIITDFGFNNLVNITSVSEEERGGETGDKYITISFRTHRDLKIQTLGSAKTTSTVKKVALKNNRPTTKSNSRIYVVKPGDSLWKIAKWWYGNGVKWNIIYQKNRNIIGSNPNVIRPGQKLVM
ncbi:phage portal protein [Clostridium botulinum]|uniref:LysM peptidoglycan-binding domain-containing protein n=1 Tax=Clostridium botulinum TaxID=1491 RepID=A0ABD7CGH7_CLOBO|nr:LysM peptidoglycan-binding domain-containing protein [Clostridium botulinum]KGO14290.1 phage portal protein [Clostridium botulinum]QRI52256.1 LysM peptidoglycan-binding domain-containing protein [Clostridium botulinum]